MKKRPDIIEILMPNSGSTVYSESPILVRDDYVVIHQEDRTVEYPLHRVHRTITKRGDEE